MKELAKRIHNNKNGLIMCLSGIITSLIWH